MSTRSRWRVALLMSMCALLWGVPVSPAHALPLFSFSATTLAFPSTVVGDTSAGIAVVVTNVSGSAQVLTVAGGAAGSPEFGAVQDCAGVTLAAGATCSFTYTFAPVTVGAHTATTSFTVNGESSGAVSLSGTATPTFSISPTTLTFPSTAVGDTSAAIDVVVTNISTAPKVLSVAGGASGDANFGAAQSCAGVTLAAGATCTFSYTFTPATVGPHSATTNFTVNGQSSGAISLSGTATAAFTISPTTLSFPPTAVAGTSAPIDVVVTNVSASARVITAAGGAAGDPNFDAVQNCAGVTLAPGATCAFTYTFIPQVAGVHTATTSFSINGQSSGTITLTGATPGATVSPTPTPTTATASTGGTTVTLGHTGSPIAPLAPAGVLLVMVVGSWLVLRDRRVAQRQTIRRR